MRYLVYNLQEGHNGANLKIRAGLDRSASNASNFIVYVIQLML